MIRKKSILDVFTQIRSEHEASKPDLCIRLWNHLHKPQENIPDEVLEEGNENNSESENVPKEVTYTLGRLIQGLGSPRAHIRKCYFSTLVSILSNNDDTLGPITLTYFRSLIDKHLSKFESKGERGEVLTGRILAYGVALRSKVFSKSTVELQQEVITEMLTKCKERSYLPLLSYTFLVDFLHTIDENTFKTVIWPVLINEILVNWQSQTFETLYCLLEVFNKYPQLFKKKMILSALHSHTILHAETIENVVNMLTNVNWEPRLKHPLYKTISVSLAQEENSELMLTFWTNVENVLHNSPTRIQQLAVLTTFSCLVQNLPLEKITELLTPSFVHHLVNSCKSPVTKADKSSINGRTVLQLVVSRAIEKTEESTSASVYTILCRLLFETGHLLVDKITGLKIVFPCIAKLNAKHVKLIAKKCENVILLSKKNDNVRWTFKDRCYATQLLARLIGHPQSQDMNWKIKHLKFMLKNSLFVTNPEEGGHVSNELAAVLKNSFFTALSHQLSHLENHRMVLISLVFYIDTMLKNDENELKTPISDEILECWNKTMSKIQKIDVKIKETAERKTVMYVFQTLFLQMALHLFVDAEVARDILKELNRCFKKEKVQFEAIKNKENNKNANIKDPEPKWIAIAVELFLSLLSRDTFLLRQLISRIFPHFCPYLTAQASSQILEVLNPESGNDMLTDENEVEDAEGSDVNDEDDDDENTEIDEDESDSNIEDDDDVEENAIDKTRRAVRDALGIAGSVTDTESVDLDDMDEEEGRRLDMALSEAFKSTHQKSQTKNKKQSASDRALTNFRIRVMDLVDIYLDNDPPLALVLDTIPMLFALLEFCIKDSHQKPLETRIRSTLKKIGNLKKCKNLDEVEKSNVVDILKNLINKGDRSAPIFLDLSLNISECCAFLLRMGIQISSHENGKKTKDTLFNVFAEAIKDFFMRRDCLLPLNLFENILLKICWTENVKLCQNIASYAFDPAVRGFRRNQSLTLLSYFYKNTRLGSMLKTAENKDYANLEDYILNQTINLLNLLKNKNTPELKPTFICELFSLLYTIKSSKFCVNVPKWENLSQLLQSFLNNGSFGLNVLRKHVIKLGSLLNIHATPKKSDSRKRKIIEENKKPAKIVKNGYINDHIHSEHDDSDCSEIAENTQKVKKNENTVDQTIVKKKKSKRKTKEHFNSKKLRSETLANDIEVFNFSKASMMET